MRFSFWPFQALCLDGVPLIKTPHVVSYAGQRKDAVTNYLKELCKSKELTPDVLGPLGDCAHFSAYEAFLMIRVLSRLLEPYGKQGIYSPAAQVVRRRFDDCLTGKRCRARVGD